MGSDIDEPGLEPYGRRRRHSYHEFILITLAKDWELTWVSSAGETCIAPGTGES